MLRIERIVAATRNPRKLEELRRLLRSLGIETVSLSDFEDLTEAEETGGTFAENARLKALSYCEQTGLPCVADDSGLEVEALGGAPGVFSSRYAGPGADDRALCNKLLSEMRSVPDGERNARFRCCVALAADGRILLSTESEARGIILREMRGKHGFGYDPVFVPEGAGRTFAEMEPHEKDALSHRGKALALFTEEMEKFLRSQGGNAS